MTPSRIQAEYQNPKKYLILAQFSNSPWTGAGGFGEVALEFQNAPKMAQERGKPLRDYMNYLAAHKSHRADVRGKELTALSQNAPQNQIESSQPSKGNSRFWRP
jgi:hypothetical protein